MAEMAAHFKYARDQPAGFTNRIKKVAIIGAGGQIGVHLLEHVVKKGIFDVTVIQRPVSTGTLPAGVDLVRVDYSGDDDTALVDALRGQQALIITMAVRAPRDTMSKLIRAAAKASVPYILPNWYGHDPANDEVLKDSMLLDRRNTMLGLISELGVSTYFLLACGFWYEFSLGGGTDRYGFDFVKRTLTWFDEGNAAIDMTTWPQCGRAVANLLSFKELPDDEDDDSPTLAQFANGPVYVSSFKVSQRDMFESVKHVTGTTDADWTITHESAEQRWKEGTRVLQTGDPNGFVKMLYSRKFFPNGDNDFHSPRGLDNAILGLPAEDLNEWTAVAVRMGENGEVATGH